MLKRTLKSLVHIQRESKSTMLWIDIDKNIYNELTVVLYKVDVCRIPVFGRERRFETEHIITEKKGVIGFGTDKK